MTEKQVRVNITSRVNSAAIRREKMNGREVIVVPSVTLPDNIVMNGIRYPAEEIDKSYHTLENTPAPYGHPQVNGEFVSAKSPLGLNIGYFGAYNANVRRENGRVYLDKIIDVDRAMESAMGQEVINAVKEGKPIHTSTGLLCNLGDGDDDADYTALNMEFDHDAILLNEEGAATPAQGVGMMVNSKGDRIEVINSYLDDAEAQIDYLGKELMRAVVRKEDATKWARVKSAVLEALGLGREIETNSNEAQEMTEVTKEQFDELSAQVNTIAEALGKLDIAGAVADAVAPITEQLNADKVAKEAAANAAKDKLVEQVVNKGILAEAVAKATPAEALEAMLNSGGNAAGVGRGFDGDKANDGFGAY